MFSSAVVSSLESGAQRVGEAITRPGPGRLSVNSEIHVDRAQARRRERCLHHSLALRLFLSLCRVPFRNKSCVCFQNEILISKQL